MIRIFLCVWWGRLLLSLLYHLYIYIINTIINEYKLISILDLQNHSKILWSFSHNYHKLIQIETSIFIIIRIHDLIYCFVDTITTLLVDLVPNIGKYSCNKLILRKYLIIICIESFKSLFDINWT